MYDFKSRNYEIKSPIDDFKKNNFIPNQNDDL